MLIENLTNELFLLRRMTTAEEAERASELVSDKFICTYLGKANHISLI